MIEGNEDSAMTAARRIVAQIPVDQLPAFPFLEDFLVVPYYTEARFGKWDQILGEPAPPADQRFATAIWHYARGLAYTRGGKREEAGAEYAALAAAADDAELVAMVYDTSGGTAGERLAVAKHHLAGEMAAARGERKTAVAELTEAIRVQDAMPYAEPPPFYFPVRQALGAVLLRAGRPREAEAVYLEDLRRYPRNGWSLYGLSRAFAAQGKAAQARATAQGFRNAWARADVELQSSRF
jgi:tetratricopeptide (TPR) repeat protein